MHIAYCSDVEVFNKDQLRDQQWSYRFPGSGWVTCLYRMVAESGVSVVSGDVALANIFAKRWNATDVYVIQDMNSKDASKLLDLGANPFLITCFEAPLYAPFFYDRVRNIAEKFKFTLGFGFSEEISEDLVSRKYSQFRFPSFYLEDMRVIRPWSNRKNMVLVAANKYKSKTMFIPNRLSLIGALRRLKWASWRFISPSYNESLTDSLHDKRLEAIEYFANKHELDLYGSGWGCLDNLPRAWVRRLKALINDQYRGQCSNKLETISGYQFCICFENMALAGYVTEKIVDCFVAGTIPLYIGAPDIASIIPPESFIDVRNFSSFEQLDIYINSIKEADALAMLEAGRAYLQTETGMLHSYEGFAKNVIRLLKIC